MADNTKIDAGTSGDLIATDDINGVKFQRVKIALGADGDNDGDVSSTNPIPISATSLPLPTGAAKDGTDITSPTEMPAGGVGIRGWLSAIWTKLNATIGVTGTFWQATQPVSAVSLPLPTDAATSAKQEGFIERAAFAVLKRLSIDASGRLRVAAESAVISSGTVTTVGAVTNITNWGLSTPTAKSQWESQMQFQTGFRRNLVHS